MRRIANDDRAPIWLFGSDDFAEKVRSAMPERWILRPDAPPNTSEPMLPPAAVLTDLDGTAIGFAEAWCTGSRPIWVVIGDNPTAIEPIGPPAAGPVPVDHYVRRGLDRIRRAAANRERHDQA